VVVAWLAILFTGTYPGGMFDFVEGVIRWRLVRIRAMQHSSNETRRSSRSDANARTVNATATRAHSR